MLREYHVDALDRYNVTCDFAGVIRELRDPHKRFPFQVCSSFSIMPHFASVNAVKNPCMQVPQGPHACMRICCDTFQ